MTAPTDELRAIASAATEFRSALFAMPFGQDRLASGQQFNVYESGANDEDDDPNDWEFYLSLGPITDCVQIMGIEGKWRAKLVEAALRVAMRFDPALLDRLAALEAERTAGEARVVELERVLRALMGRAENFVRGAIRVSGTPQWRDALASKEPTNG